MADTPIQTKELSTTMPKLSNIFALLSLFFIVLACGPKVNVQIIRTTVRPFPNEAPPQQTLDRFLPNTPPSPFTLAGGPATFTGPDEIGSHLATKPLLTQADTEKNEPTVWAQEVSSIVTVEFTDPIGRPVGIEIYELATPEKARLFEKAYFSRQQDRMHQLEGNRLVFAFWFDPHDEDLASAGQEFIDVIVGSIQVELSAPSKPGSNQ